MQVFPSEQLKMLADVFSNLRMDESLENQGLCDFGGPTCGYTFHRHVHRVLLLVKLNT